jgi:glutamate carboxypeptidase
MDLNALPFDSETMLAALEPWVRLESPTYDAGAVNRMMDLAAHDLAIAGALTERIPGRMGLGDCLRARLPHPQGDAPGILVLGHFDTVHPLGTLAALPFRRDGERCYGPGIWDMKGGNFLALEAVRVLQRVGIATPLPVTFLFTSDEEIGSPSTRELIEAEAARQRFVLVPEPALTDGGVVSGRYAIARFNLEALGTPSHAGARLADGRSAIRLMAQRLIEIEAMTDANCTFSVGVIRGGQWVNCVASRCTAEALSMAKRQADLERGVARMLALNEDGGALAFRVERAVTRPVWEPDAGTLALYERARSLAAQLGIELSHKSVGGGSDGNFTGAMGIPTLDGLGCEGDQGHTLEEHILVPSLARRGRLTAGLLATLGAD